MIENNEIFQQDLRSAITLLQSIEGQLISTNTEVDLYTELTSIYRYVGAGGTCQRPTKNGPAMMFNTIKGFPHMQVVIGLMSTRERVGYLLKCKTEKLGFLLSDAINNLIHPKIIKENAQCQEVIHFATETSFDLRKLLPVPTNTEEDAGPYITMGMCYASDPETNKSDVTIHRLCVHNHDELSIWLTPGRHIGMFHKKAEKMNKSLPISISIGVDPAIEIAACFEPPTTPIGFNELSIGGALRGYPVELVQCVSINELAIAHSEIVIEGELLPKIRVREDKNTNTGKAMPEFLGYTGKAKSEVPVIKVKAITHRKNPILQTTLGPSGEHVNMVGIPTEASILYMLNRAMPNFVLNIHAHPSGGGKLLLIIQVKKISSNDEGRQRQAALIAFSAFSELKHIILVDEDVDIFDTDDILWAMQTRYQGDVDTLTIPGVRCHPLDPSQVPEYSPNISEKGITCKTIFDCTMPWHIRHRFKRSKFKYVDIQRFLPDFKN